MKEFNDQSPIGGKASNMGLIGFILAIVSLLLPLEGIDLLVGIAAIVVSSIGLKEEKKGFAIAGLIIGIVAVIGALVLSLTGGYDFL
jgi:hypothetical protein